MILMDRHNAQEDFQQLAAAVQETQAPTAQTIETTGTTHPPETTQEPTEPTGPLPQYQQLYAQNPELAGWLRIDDTVIDYPVMHTPENPEYYIRRNFDKKSSSAGCLFLQGDADPFLPSDNLTVYGHHMKNGSMFGYLTRYRNQGWYDTHPVMWLVTPEAVYQIDVLAGRTVSASDGAYTIYNSEETFRPWLEDFVSKSDFRSETAVEDAAQIIALSTCTYTYDDARYVLVGALKPYVEETLP
jgi:sortase B